MSDSIIAGATARNSRPNPFHTASRALRCRTHRVS